MENVWQSLILFLVVAALGAGALIGFFKTKTPGWGDFTLKVMGLILVATFATLLAVAPLQEHVQTGAMGILGTIAGYLFGRQEKNKEQPAPVISSFAPTNGTVDREVVITGENLLAAKSVTFGGTKASFKVNSSTQITTTVPAGAITGRISVTTPGGKTESIGNFTVN